MASHHKLEIVAENAMEFKQGTWKVTTIITIENAGIKSWRSPLDYQYLLLNQPPNKQLVLERSQMDLNTISRIQLALVIEDTLL